MMAKRTVRNSRVKMPSGRSGTGAVRALLNGFAERVA